MILKKSALYIGEALWTVFDDEQKRILESKNIHLSIIQNKLKLVVLYISVSMTLMLLGLIADVLLEILLSVCSLCFIRWWDSENHFSVDVCYIVTISVILVTITLSEVIPESHLVIVLLLVLLVHLIFKRPRNFLDLRKKMITFLLILISYFINSIFLIMWLVLIFDIFKIEGTGRVEDGASG
ncbi:hypothetical protein ACFQZE_06840 [Paenibacillus sp. GCM10027627]|uniref:hypothetical protein n=1 Tax=unclassified Paenibacillus TaxID=185978 RepID=UPI003638B090